MFATNWQPSTFDLQKTTPSKSDHFSRPKTTQISSRGYFIMKMWHQKVTQSLKNSSHIVKIISVWKKLQFLLIWIIECLSRRLKSFTLNDYHPIQIEWGLSKEIICSSVLTSSTSTMKIYEFHQERLISSYDHRVQVK